MQLTKKQLDIVSPHLTAGLTLVAQYMGGGDRNIKYFPKDKEGKPIPGATEQEMDSREVLLVCYPPGQVPISFAGTWMPPKGEKLPPNTLNPGEYVCATVKYLKKDEVSGRTNAILSNLVALGMASPAIGPLIIDKDPPK